MRKFQILKAYLWLLYRIKFEFIVHTFTYEIEELNFLTSEALKKFCSRHKALKLFWKI